MGPGTSPGIKRPRRVVDLRPHVESKLKAEKSYIATPLWAFAAVSRMNFAFAFTINYEYLQQISVQEVYPLTQSHFWVCLSLTKQKDMLPVSHTLSSRPYNVEKQPRIWRI